MAKTNYTKVEEALAEGMRKMSVNRLLDAADEASKSKTGKTVKPAEGQLLAAVHADLKHLKKQGQDPYKKCGIDKSELKSFFDTREQLPRKTGKKSSKSKPRSTHSRKNWRKFLIQPTRIW